jgi:tetratricopeptide (TPR) repeat protein
MRDQESVAKNPRIRALVLAAVIAGLALSVTSCSKQKSEAQLASEALASGLAAHQAGMLAEAAADYREVLVHDPNNKYAYYNLGLIDQTNGSMASADSNYNLAIVKTAEDDLADAIALYKRAIRAQPDYADAHLNLGFALIEKGEEQEGNAELKKAVELDPSLAKRIPEQPAGASGQSSATPSASESRSPSSSPS